MDVLVFRLIVVFLAIVFDFMGEPPERLHPVVWMGRFISFFEEKIDSCRRIFGFVVFLSIALLFTLPIHFIPSTFFWIVPSAFIAKTMFSLSSLLKMVDQTYTDDIEEKREFVGKLVSRDTSNLDEDTLNSAAVETAAENFTDSVVGPLFYFFLFGLPGIVFYRVTNTMDAMVGYKNDRFKEFGEFPARMDDLLNFVPSRLAAFLLILSSERGGALEVVKKHRKIKLNPGWTISAISGVLDRRIRKDGFYDINREKIFPRNNDIKRTLTIIKKAFVVFVLLVSFLMGVLSYFV